MLAAQSCVYYYYSLKRTQRIFFLVVGILGHISVDTKAILLLYKLGTTLN
jgi:hypothetical protein